MTKTKPLDPKELEKIINQLRGVDNINKSNLEMIIYQLGPSLDKLVIQIHQTIRPEAKANSLITILLEFYTKFGVAIQSRSLLKHLDTNKATLYQYSPKHKSLREISVFSDYAVFSSGTNETGEIDVSARTEQGRYFGFSAKANKIKVTNENINQNLAFGDLDVGKMGEFKTNYNSVVSAIVVEKSNIRIPSNAPEVSQYLIDRTILNEVVQDCYQYAQEALANKETILKRLNKGAIVKLNFHQNSGVHQISQIMIKYKNKPKKAKRKINKILVHYHPRSGKIILTLAVMKVMDFNKVLVLTQFPYLNQEWVGTIKRFAEYSDISIIDIPFGDLVPENLDPNKKYLILGSLQGTKSHQSKIGILNGEFKYKKLETIVFDLLVADEAHEAFLTPKTAKILNKINRIHDLFLTGTASKLIAAGEFSDKNTISWDLVDREKFLADKSITQELKVPYLFQPRLAHWLVTLRTDFYQSINKYFKEGLGFSFNKLLETMGEDTLEFVHKGDVITTIQYFLGDRNGILKSQSIPSGSISALFKEESLSQKIKKQLGYDPRCSLIFVDTIAQQKALYNLLNSEFKSWLLANNTEVFMTNSQENDSGDVQKLVKELNTYPKRTIVIAVEQLKLGVTIKTCDLVVLMTDTQNITSFEQMSYRPLSEDLSISKQWGIVLDLNPARSLLLSVQEIRQNPRYKNKSTLDAFKEKHAAIPLFQDGKLLDMKDQSQLKVILKSISQQLLEQNGITGYFKLGSGEASEFNGHLIKKLLKLNLPNSPKFLIQENQIPKGGNPTSINKSSIPIKTNTNDVSKARENARYLLNCLPWLLLIAKQLGTELDSFKEVIEFYSNAPKKIPQFGTVRYKHLLNEVIFGLGTVKNLNAKDYGVIITQFNKVQTLNDDIKRFHEDFNNAEINFNFLGNTKNALKNVLGQVVTSNIAIKQLVDSIPAHEFSNPNNTFFDKCCGSGGILVEIVNRLDEGLKTVIPDKEIRHKHILEKMIFGNDVITKNVLITQLRLNPHGKYKLNIQVKDSLIDSYFPKNCLVVSNPATEKIVTNQWVKLRPYSNFNINRIDMVLLDIATHNTNVKSLHLILPANITTNKKSESARNYLNQFNIKKINLFVNNELGPNIDYDFMVISVEKTPKDVDNLVHIVRGDLNISKLQSYICDPTLPHWTLFRDASIDKVFAERELGAFSAYRDRGLSSKMYNTDGKGIRILLPSEVTTEGITNSIAGVSRYIEESKIPSSTLSYLNRPNLYLAPNLVSKTARMVPFERDCLVDGAFAILSIINDPLRELSSDELSYFASEEFKEFYEKVTNYQHMSKNLDGGFIYWWGILKKTS